MIIKFKKIHPEANAPFRAHAGDAGWDLSVVSVESLGNGVFKYHTGIAVEIPAGFFGLLRPRSSVCKSRYIMASSGVIDAGFRGEICIPLRRVGEGLNYKPPERVCQLLILPLPDVEMVEAELSETGRGDGGFGSTGK